MQAALLQRQNDVTLHVPGYVWITLGWYRDNWWTRAVSQDELPQCTDDLLEPLLYQSIGIQQSNSAEDNNTPTDVNLVSYIL